METPVLSKKQLRSTLSARKKRPKETLKNVLAIPYNTSFWPVISPEDRRSLNDLLVEHLPMLKSTAGNISWDQVKGIPKSDRKTFREQARAALIGQKPSSAKKIGISLGVNDVTKLLEKNMASAILLHAEVQPRVMVQHVLDHAVLYKVPVLIFENLKSLLRKQCGIPSIAFAICREIPSDSNIYLIKAGIENIFAKVPPPENHINYNRSLDSFKTRDMLEEKEPVRLKEELKIDVKEIHKSVYLKRPASGRAFVPKEEIPKKVMLMEADETGFIPFSDNIPAVIPDNPSNNKYKHLVVKRLKGDPNRNKRKIESLKKNKAKKKVKMLKI